jgi:hypothetical protein
MTLTAYRVGVVLRWSELQSLKEKGTPLKINLQKLRKSCKWPTCKMDETPVVEEVGELPYRASEDGSEMPQYVEYEDNLVPGDVEVVLIRRCKSKWIKQLGKIDLRDYDFIDIDDENNTQPTNITADPPETSRGEPVTSSNLDQPKERPFESSRRMKRAARNNEFIDRKIRNLDARASTLREEYVEAPRERKSHLKKSLIDLENGITNLYVQRSDVDHLRERFDRTSRNLQFAPPVVPGPSMNSRGFKKPITVTKRTSDKVFSFVRVCGSCRLPFSSSCCDNLQCDQYSVSVHIRKNFLDK